MSSRRAWPQTQPFSYYERHGFKLPLPDTAGPDAKPDIYIASLPAGVFGLTFPETAQGGTFVLILPDSIRAHGARQPSDHGRA